MNDAGSPVARQAPLEADVHARGDARGGIGQRLRAMVRWWSGLDRRRDQVPDLVPFRRLALQLHVDLPRAASATGGRTVLVVTPQPSGLLPTATADLARCLADELRRPVLLVDAGIDASELSQVLGAGGRPGFSDRMADPALPLGPLALRTSHENVSFLPAGTRRGPTLPAPPEELDPLLSSLQGPWDFVLVYGGPLLRESMALALAPHAGCVLLVAVENETRMSDLDAARDLLALGKARRVALVLLK